MRTPIRVILLLACLASVTVRAITYVAFEQITVAGTAIGFTSTKIAANGQPQAGTASCRAETAEIRYTVDGTTPTSSVGTLLEPGDALTLTDHDLMVRFLAIRTTGSSGQLDCTYTKP